MSGSLRDQLLKAGVASKQQARKVTNEQRNKKKRKDTESAFREDKRQAQRTRAQQSTSARALNRQKQNTLERNATVAQIRQLIESNRLSLEGGETPFRFVDGVNVRTLYVPEEIYERLGQGLLRIVRFDGGYEIVTATVAEKISVRDESVLIARDDSDSVADEDDPYADYKVPDDLRW